jgi:hypothetical protein
MGLLYAWASSIYAAALCRASSRNPLRRQTGHQKTTTDRYIPTELNLEQIKFQLAANTIGTLQVTKVITPHARGQWQRRHRAHKLRQTALPSNNIAIGAAPHTCIRVLAMATEDVMLALEKAQQKIVSCVPTLAMETVSPHPVLVLPHTYKPRGAALAAACRGDLC